jgi:hypothetical protein
MKYVEIEKGLKSLGVEKDSLRPYVCKLLKRCKSLGVMVKGITFYEQERYNFKEEELYTWVKSQVDENTLDSITKKTIDLEKLHELSLDGGIDTLNIPESCYSVNWSPVIKINHKEI